MGLGSAYRTQAHGQKELLSKARSRPRKQAVCTADSNPITIATKQLKMSMGIEPGPSEDIYNHLETTDHNSNGLGGYGNSYIDSIEELSDSILSQTSIYEKEVRQQPTVRTKLVRPTDGFKVGCIESVNGDSQNASRS